MGTPAATPVSSDTEPDALVERASVLARELAATSERERALPPALVE